MESPVRICIGAALVVNLLLLSSSTANGSALRDANSTSVKYDGTSNRYLRINGTTGLNRNRTKTPDAALNELNAKESVSEEYTDKNAKYKHRGRVRFNSENQSSSESNRRRVRTSTTSSTTTTTTTPETLSTTSKVMIITPEPEKKNVSQIIDSMRNYKKTKMPVTTSSTTPLSISKNKIVKNNEYEDDDDFDKEVSEKFTPSDFHESSFFNFPGFDDDETPTKQLNHPKKETDNYTEKEHTGPSLNGYSTFFPKENLNSKINDESYKSDNFFDNFDFDLTTPKNEFFDKKYQEISSSIIKNLNTVKTKSKTTVSEKPNQKVLTRNVDVQKIKNGSPNNKSTVIIKNTKEIRYIDNEGAGTANQELSDVHGTSIYYEMSVLSTETYAINHNSDDDCDEDADPIATPSTPAEEESKGIKTTTPTVVQMIKHIDQPSNVTPNVSTKFTPTTSSVSTKWSSSQNSILSTEETSSTKNISTSISRNRTYPKRLNVKGDREANKLNSNIDQSSSNQILKTTTPRKFHYTTPKSKPIWMAPRRNYTRGNIRNTSPTTIFSEYFDIKDKLTTTPRPRQPTRTVLTTVSSDIDPVLQSDVGGIKKVVHSQSISENSIPTLWKRGSTKFATTTASSKEEQDDNDLEIPPTLTAWALASLRSPPPSPVPKNITKLSTEKIINDIELKKDENELEKNETTVTKLASIETTIPTMEIVEITTTPKPKSGDESSEFSTKQVADMNENKLNWKPEYITTNRETYLHKATTEFNREKQESEAESKIAYNTSPQSASGTSKPFGQHEISAADVIGLNKNPPPWEQPSVLGRKNITTTLGDTGVFLLPVGSTKIAGFESITKLPTGITTPQGDDVIGATENQQQKESNTAYPLTTDYEITTIRFTYVPTISEQATEITDTETISANTPGSVEDARYTTTTAIQDTPVTTYRPKYVTTTDITETTEEIHESTTMTSETMTPMIETTKQMVTTGIPTTTKSQTLDVTTPNLSEITERPQMNSEDMTTIIVEVVTEINSERKLPGIQTTKSTLETTTAMETSTDGKNNNTTKENDNEIITEIITKSTTMLVPTTEPVTIAATTAMPTESEQDTVELVTTKDVAEIQSTTAETKRIDNTMKNDDNIDSSTESLSTKSVSELEDLTTYNEEVTTEASSRVLTTDEARSGAAIAIAVSTIGVIALILLVGLLLVVRRRGRRGVYAQRCTPVSLDAYSLDSVSVGHRKGNHRLRASKRSYGNPAYDDEVTSHPMQYAALANFALDVDSICAEFAEIPSVSVRPEEVPPGCEDKNRYSNVLPLPETRVPLRRIGSDPTTEYINANYITGPGNIKNYYIACQAPLHNTVTDFWRMIWEQNSRLIVMLTEYMENGVEKCYEYLPPSEISDNKRTFGDYQIILKKREQKDKYAVSSVQLINLRTRSWREITHMWYFWPAKGVPDDYDSVIDFLSEMRGYMKMSQSAKEFDEEGLEVIYGDQNRTSFHNLSKLRSEDSNNGNGNGVNVYSPQKAEEQLRRTHPNNGTLSRMKAAAEIEGVRACVVVCASGAGRSAALIALDVCARALAAGAVDVPRVVREIRAQRPHSLANKHHYIFLYKVLSEYGNKLMGGGVDTI